MEQKTKRNRILLVIGAALLTILVYVCMVLATTRGKDISGKMPFFVMHGIAYFILLVVVVSVFVLVLLYKKKLPMERIYLVAGIGMGLVFMLMIPMMAVPDEHSHMFSAYDVSDYLMGTHDDKVVMRVDDASRVYNPVNVSQQDYISEYKDFFSMANNTELEKTLNEPLKAPKYLFLAPAIGITLGRLFGLGTTLTFMLGRLFNMLLFVFAIYYAIKKMPFAKGVIFVWALLPITLQQASSFSYDAPVNALAAVVIALTLSLAYGTYESDKRKKKDIIILFIFCLLLLPCKGFALLPIVVLPLMMLPGLIKKYKSQIITFKENLKPAIKWSIIAGLVVVGLGVLFVGYRVIVGMLAPDRMNNQVVVPWTGEYAYTMGYLIKNPVLVAKLVVNSVGGRGDLYLKELFGGALGWLEIPIPWMFLVVFMFLIVYASLRRESEKQLVSVGTKLWMLLLCAGACLLVLLAMCLYWTPCTVTTIEGVQGRYFLPALLLGVICMRTKRTQVSDEADNYVMLWTVFMQIIVVAEIFKNILER